ncbi:MAG: hypothetical protein VST71_13175 [Nitrospirota bacterium]|nr:hypothetical protein [Nitrospirota bacterium]
MATHEVTINLSDEILEEIERYKNVRHKKSIDDAVAELIKYALTFPPYFKYFDWEKAEAEADKEIAAGKTKSFETVEDFIADLRK